MKKYCLILFASLFCLTAYSQVLFNKYKIKGGKEGKNYAAIISSTMSKKEIVEKVFETLGKDGLSMEGEKTNTISDDMSEFKIRFNFTILDRNERLFGMVVSECPLRFHCDYRFEFYDNGNVLFCCENFDVEILTIWRESYTNSKRRDSKTMQEFLSREGNFQKRKKLYDRMVQEGFARWYFPNNYVYALEQGWTSWRKSEAKRAKKLLSNNILLGVTKKTWEEDIVTYFDNDFIKFSKKINGEIIGVAEDGNQIWALKDGKLLPTDKTLQKEFIRNNKTYYNQ